jgi:hypothetical protein
MWQSRAKSRAAVANGSRINDLKLALWSNFKAEEISLS